jgi:hypothetical protein
VSGHATALPRSVMKSRRSFDHLVGEREQRRRRTICSGARPATSIRILNGEKPADL